MQKSAQQGHPKAQYLLGQILFTGQGNTKQGIPQDEQQAFYWGNKAPENNIGTTPELIEYFIKTITGTHTPHI